MSHRGALAIAVGAATMVAPQILIPAMTIVGKMASDHAFKTAKDIAVTTSTGVLKDISEELKKDVAEGKAKADAKKAADVVVATPQGDVKVGVTVGATKGKNGEDLIIVQATGTEVVTPVETSEAGVKEVDEEPRTEGAAAAVTEDKSVTVTEVPKDVLAEAHASREKAADDAAEHSKSASPVSEAVETTREVEPEATEAKSDASTSEVPVEHSEPATAPATTEKAEAAEETKPEATEVKSDVSKGEVAAAALGLPVLAAAAVRLKHQKKKLRLWKAARIRKQMLPQKQMHLMLRLRR
jgi:hypothetical protein